MGGNGPSGGKADGVSGEVTQLDIELQSDGHSELVAFDVPDDAISFTVALSGSDAHTFGIVRLVDPHGDVLIEQLRGGPDYIAFASQLSALRSEAFSGHVGLTVPSNSEIPLVPGRWQMQVAGSDDDWAPVAELIGCAIIVKRAPEPPITGHLDVHLHFAVRQAGVADLVRDARWSEQGAPTNAALQDALARTRELYREVGIEVRFASFNDISLALNEPTELFGEDNDLIDLFEAGRQDHKGVNVFFVDFLGAVGSGVIGGVSPLVAGPGVLPGETKLGVVVRAHSAAISADLPHELGHFLGLWHTVEANGRHFDRLEDTDAANLMFWRSRPSASRRLTPQQGQMMLGSPLIGHN